jgi:hypothetical protein
MRRHPAAFVLTLTGLFASGVAVAAAPQVAKTSPAANATDVSPDLGEIVVTFDMAMKANSHSLVVLGDLEFPEFAGDDPITFRDDRTLVVKVKLAPSHSYGIGINSATRTGFKSADDGTPATPFELRFKTAATAAKPAAPAAPAGPHVVKTDPSNGATGVEAGTFDLTIVFSEPMKKAQASLGTPADSPRLKLLGKARWENARTFVVPVMLETGKNYRVGINVGESKPFVTAGDDTPADAYELAFSTTGAPAAGRAASQPASGPAERSTGPVRLRYDYRKGDAGRVIRQSTLDLKLKMSSGQTIPIGHKMGLNCIEEITGVEEGRPVETRKIISEYMMTQVNPQTGESQSAPRLEKPVTVKVDRTAEPIRAEAVDGEAPDELMALLSEDAFADLLPTEPIEVGRAYDLPPKTLAEIKKGFDPAGTGKCKITLTPRRIGSLEVEDARNEMFRAKGGGEPATYEFKVVEFAVDWKQDGAIQGDVAVPFTMEANGKVVFAIDAGVVLSTDVDAKLTIKPFEQQDENGQPIRISGGGTCTMRNSFQPIKWTRGAALKRGKSAGTDVVPPADASRESTPAKAATSSDVQATMATPAGSIAHQLALLKQGDVDALKKCFTEDVRERITEDAVKKGQENIKGLSIDDLVAEVIEGEGLGSSKTTKIKMKNGRTLTTLVLTDDKWLAETVWFK